MSNKSDFTGKVVVVTGSSSGIGAGIAVEFSRSGAQVVITGRNSEKLSEVAKQCVEVSPKRLKPLEVVADVCREDDCNRLIDSTINSFSKLDVLVNNAGTAAFTSVEETNIMYFYDKLFATNLRSVVYLTHLSVKHLEKTKGNIVNISSTNGLKPAPHFSIYCTTKCALDMFTKCTALELGSKGIRVNIVNPGAVKTNLGAAIGVDPDQYNYLLEQRGKSYPMGRIGEPVDVANAVLFLASDNCSWVTGANFVTDGGGLYGVGRLEVSRNN